MAFEMLGAADVPDDGNRFAVAKIELPGDLQRVPQGVAVVQYRPPPRLTFVRRHDLGLDPHAGRDALVHRKAVEVTASEEVVLRQLAEA